jgi:hypothetical protein
MKSISILTAIVFVFATFGFVQAQSKVEKKIDESCEITLKTKINDDIISFELTGVEIIKITPSGNLLRILTLRVADDEIMELANPFAFFSVTAKGDFDGDGVQETLRDGFSVLTKSGNLKLVYHSNGK